MVKVIFVKNPFSPSRERSIKLSEATNKPLSFYVEEFVNQLPKNEAYIEIDGRKVPAEYLDTCNEIVKPNSFIVVMPKIAKGGGKSILGLVAVIALSVVSFGVGGLASGAGMWGAGMGAWTFGGYLAAAAVMFLGGSLISKFMAPKIDTGKYQTEDPTYSWNGVQTMDAQGNGIAITYGKVKSGGQSLQKFTTNDGDDQYFNWLVSAGEGPLTISNIRLNDNPIGNYESVSYQIREGSNNQDIISGFGDTYVNKSVSYEINNDEWRTDEVDSNVAQGIVIELECSQGLYHAKDNGSLGTAWIKVTAQYAISGSNNWVTFVNNEQISGAKSGVVRKQFRVDNLASEKYQVRVTVNSRSADVNSSRDGVKIWWTQCNAIIYDDFSYPNTALIGIKAKATSQLSGSTPQLTFIKERANVWVWSPNANAYVERPADNPAWAAYDFIHGAKRLYDIRTNKYEMVYDGVPKELMLYEQFEAWATNCDNMNLKINIEIVSVSDFWTIVNQDIAPVGRGLVVQFGTKFGCIYDHASQPVQLFNMGNIIQGSFELSYLGTEDRADVVEVTYFDADNDYEKSVITIYADDYDDIDIPNQPTQLTFNGITSYEQAYREGKYQLFCNKLLQETITFKTDVEAISCQVGDLILVSHDVPEWSYSGRIDKVNADGSVAVGLDIEEIALPEGETWGIMVRDSTDNTLATYTVSEVSGKYGEVKVKATSSIKASEGDLFSLGRINSVVKPFVVKSLQKSGDLEYTISALEYVEGVYSEDYTIPEPEYSLADAPITQVTNLEISANSYTNDGGNPAKTLYLTWDGTGTANIYLSSDNGETYYLAASTSKNNAAIEVDPFVDYKVKVLTSNKNSETTPVIQDVSSNAGQFLPPKATNFVLKDGRWSWEYEYSNWVDYFELRLDTNCGRETNLLERTFVPYSLKMPNISSGTAYLYIRNRFGQYNEPATFAFTINAPAAPTSAPVLTATADGVVVDMVALPRGCTGYKVHVVTDDGVDAIFNVSTQRWVYYKYSGTIIVSYCIVNEITDGVYSPTATTTIRDIEPADGSITSAKLAANAVTAGKIAANAVTADNIAANSISTEKLASSAINLTGLLSIVGGAVTLDETGLKVSKSNGGYAIFDSRGITFVDAQGIDYAQLHRICIGTGKNGAYVSFSKPWDSVPKVICIPTEVKCADTSFSANNLYVVCHASNVTVNGFNIVCYTKLAGGNSTINLNSSFPAQSGTIRAGYVYDTNAFQNMWGTSNYVGYELSYSTTISISGNTTSCVVYATAKQVRTGKLDYSTIDDSVYSTTYNLKVYNGSTGNLIGETGFYESFSNGNSSVERNISLNLSLSVASGTTSLKVEIVCGVCYARNNSSLHTYTKIQPSATIQSVRIDGSGEVIVDSNATAAFIAVENSSTDYTIS